MCGRGGGGNILSKIHVPSMFNLIFLNLRVGECKFVELKIMELNKAKAISAKLLVVNLKN